MRNAAARKGNLTEHLTDTLRSAIVGGTYGPGVRLPSETTLATEHGVSRSVVREAIAALRADGLVNSRQGSGVYVNAAGMTLGSGGIDFSRVAQVIEMLELRTAVEAEAADLAARRHSPAQEEEIVESARRVSTLARAGQSTAEADLAFHIAIAQATNNPRFGQFLAMLGQNAIPRRALVENPDEMETSSYVALIEDEHAAIVRAIQQGDSAAARRAMRRHLQGAQSRYRALMQDARS
jgi:DNA-binding FadR family transcriptional regulator